MTTTKLTKKEIYAGIKAALTGCETEVSVDAMLELCDKEIAGLDKRSARAKEKAEAKKTASDPLGEEVFNLLTEDYQTTADITAQIADQDTSVSKVSYRLRMLVEAGKAEVADVEIPATETSKKRSLKGYRIFMG